MKATDSQQTELLSLGDLDLEIKRSKTTLNQLTNGAQFEQLRAQQRALAGRLIEARNALDSVELDLKRAEADLELVDLRVKKDNTILLQTSSPKDAQGIQAELSTLARRQSELEDAQLMILERKESAEAVYTEILAEKSGIDSELSELEGKVETEVIKFRSGLDLLTQRRQKQAVSIEPDLLKAYELKAARSIAIGRLNGRECGACRIGIGATALAEILALPKDSFATCPECQAFLVR